MPADLTALLYGILMGLVWSVFHTISSLFSCLLPSKDKQSILGKTALVTGAGRGLGREICNYLAVEGVKVICIDIDEKGVRETAENLQIRYSLDKALYKIVDVTDKAQVYKLAEDLEKLNIRVDILVNNAGIVTASPLLKETDESIERILRVNLLAHFWTLKAFLPQMMKRNSGHIVGISSACALTCASNIIPYAASKYGVTGLMASLREELREMKDCNIKTTTVHPFFLNSKPINVEHWKVNARLPDVDIPDVAFKIVDGIKKEEVILTVPHYMYFLMHLLWLLPVKVQDYWRDMFYAKIDSV